MSELLACCSARFAELQELLGRAGSSPTEMKGSLRLAKIGESEFEILLLKLSESPASSCQAPGSFLPHPLFWRHLLRAYRWEGMARSAKSVYPHSHPNLSHQAAEPMLFSSNHQSAEQEWGLKADTALCSEWGAPSAHCVWAQTHATERGECNSTPLWGRHPSNGWGDFHWYND